MSLLIRKSPFFNLPVDMRRRKIETENVLAFLESEVRSKKSWDVLPTSEFQNVMPEENQ